MIANCLPGFDLGDGFVSEVGLHSLGKHSQQTLHMTVTRNNFLGPAALIFSCCFPAKNGWDSEIHGFGAAHEFAPASDFAEGIADRSQENFLQQARRRGALLFGGTTLRVY
jgi:hypothetical protein